VISTLV